MSDVRVGVVGATGAVGAELLKVLDGAPWRPDTVVALAQAGTKISHVSYGEERIVVDDLALEVLEDLDLVFLALPASEAREAGERALAAGVPVVDLSGAFTRDGDVPVVVPWVNPEALDSADRRIAVVPTPGATMLGSVLAPLRQAGIDGRVSATVLVPASAAGRDGIDELSRQVVAMFNSATPPRKVFPEGLAFDLLPTLGPIGDDGWSRLEQRTMAELRALTGWEGPLAVAAVGVPVFSGISATIELTLNRQVPLELLRQILVDGGIRFDEDTSARKTPRPRRVDGQPFPHAGRLRVSPTGSVHLWVSMDNLRASAAVAVAVGATLLGDHLR